VFWRNRKLEELTQCQINVFQNVIGDLARRARIEKAGEGNRTDLITANCAWAADAAGWTAIGGRERNMERERTDRGCDGRDDHELLWSSVEQIGRHNKSRPPSSLLMPFSRIEGNPPNLTSTWRHRHAPDALSMIPSPVV
jgi:hypothetical protein